MAGKAKSARGAAKSKAQATPSSSSLVAKASSALELVHREDSGSTNKSGVKRDRTRSLEAAVAKCVKDNFKGWPDHQVHHLIINGRPLVQQLQHDNVLVMNKAKNAPAMGNKYYDELRESYALTSSPLKKLKPNDN